MVTLDQLIDQNHNYRKFKELWDLTEVEKNLEEIEAANESNFKGYPMFRLFLCLLYSIYGRSTRQRVRRVIKN
jgi:hypothetical protein